MESSLFEQHIDRVRAISENCSLFFVCGAPKSGTTWLQKALDAHSQIVCAGEGHFADKFIRKLSAPLKKYFQHQDVVIQNVYEGAGYYRHQPGEDFAFLAAFFTLGAFARLNIPSETRLIGDKTPANVEHLSLLHHVFPMAKFVNIVRDGRDALASTFKHVERVALRDGKSHDFDKVCLNKTHLYSSRWATAVASAERFGASNPGVLHTVRYEDLKEDFASAFSGVVGFLGVNVSEEEVARCGEESSFTRLSGGRQPGDENPTSFLRKGIVGDWRVSLTQQQLDIFDAIGRDWLVRLGYETASAKLMNSAEKSR